MIPATARIKKLSRGALVVAWDGIAWRSAEMIGDGVIRQRASGVADLPEEALRTAIAAHDGGGSGLQGIVIALPQVVCRTIDLPVDPTRPLPPARMSALANLRLREDLAAPGWSRSIGAALVAGGSLSSADVNLVLEEQQRLRGAIRSGLDFPQNDGYGFGDVVVKDQDDLDRLSDRFGDCALDLGLIDRGDVNAAIARQTLQGLPEGSSPACGWAPVAAGGGRRQWPWVLAGMESAARDRLAEVAAGAGLSRMAVVPLAGCAAAATDEHFNGVVVQNHHGVLIASTIVDGTQRAQEVHGLGGVWPTGDEIAGLFAGSRSTLWFCGDGMDESYIKDLATGSGCDCRLLAPPREDHVESAASAIEPQAPVHLNDMVLKGARCLALGLGPKGIGAAIAAQDERIGLLKRRGVYIGAAAVLAVAGNFIPGVFEARLDARIDNADGAISTFAEQPAVEAGGEPEELISLRAELASLRDRLALADQQKRAVGTDARAQLLVALSKVIPPLVMIDRIDDLSLVTDSAVDGDGVIISGRSSDLAALTQLHATATEQLPAYGWRLASWRADNTVRPHTFELVLLVGSVPDVRSAEQSVALFTGERGK